MQLFGGDPRIIFLKMLLEINKYYTIIMITIFICLLLLRITDQTFVFTFFVFAIVEIFRLALGIGFTRGNVPLFFVFMILTAVPLIVLDFLWLFYVDSRTGFDYVLISGILIQHFSELFFLSILQCVKFSRYQNSFYKFQYGYKDINISMDESQSNNNIIIDDY